MLIGGRIAALALSRYGWPADDSNPGDYSGEKKLESMFGPQFWERIRGKTVIDFGCGTGVEAIAMARRGAARVIGIDTSERRMPIARKNLAISGLANCEFRTRADERADVVLSLDSFEHFPDPNSVLAEMARLLNPGGRVIASFGPPWLHPQGHHLPLFSWAHLVFTEPALMRWRSQFKDDGAKRFGEVEGGLNQMSIRKFERAIAGSPLKIETMKTIPIRPLRHLHNRFTRELFTSVVRADLVFRT